MPIIPDHSNVYLSLAFAVGRQRNLLISLGRVTSWLRHRERILRPIPLSSTQPRVNQAFCYRCISPRAAPPLDKNTPKKRFVSSYFLGFFLLLSFSPFLFFLFFFISPQSRRLQMRIGSARVLLENL